MPVTDPVLIEKLKEVLKEVSEEEVARCLPGLPFLVKEQDVIQDLLQKEGLASGQRPSKSTWLL